MRLSITRRQRTMLLFLSASSYTAWFSGVGERGDAQGLAAQGPAVVTLAERRPPQRVADVISRDPFSGKPAPASNLEPVPATLERRDAVAVSPVAAAPVAGAATASGEIADSNTVPNIGADPHVAPSAASPTLTLAIRATIVGRNPVAYVANGTVMDIVRIGDTLGDRRVADIDLRGIVFADGSRLDLPETYLATPAPVSGPSAQRGLTIRDLRKLLIAPPQAGTAQVSGEQTPQAVQSNGYPTPGPLPTVNMQGLPVGVNPTPNPYNPTAFPYPYPYAPPR